MKNWVAEGIASDVNDFNQGHQPFLNLLLENILVYLFSEDISKTVPPKLDGLAEEEMDQKMWWRKSFEF